MDPFKNAEKVVSLFYYPRFWYAVFAVTFIFSIVPPDWFLSMGFQPPKWWPTGRFYFLLASAFTFAFGVVPGAWEHIRIARWQKEMDAERERAGRYE